MSWFVGRNQLGSGLGRTTVFGASGDTPEVGPDTYVSRCARRFVPDVLRIVDPLRFPGKPTRCWWSMCKALFPDTQRRAEAGTTLCPFRGLAKPGKHLPHLLGANRLLLDCAQFPIVSHVCRQLHGQAGNKKEAPIGMPL